MKKTLIGLCALATLAIGAPAQAFVLGSANNNGIPVSTVGISTSDIGSTFEVDWSKAITGATLTGDASFKIVDLTSTLLTIDIKITNSTIGTFQAAILAMGMGVTPDASNVSVLTAGSIFDSAEVQSPVQNFPGGFKNIDLCTFAANGCSGGAIGDGLQSGGNSDSFRIAVTGAFGSNPTAVALADFAIKYQTQAGSFEFAGNACVVDCGSTPGGGKVPEPGILALLGLTAFAGAAASRKRA